MWACMGHVYMPRTQHHRCPCCDVVSPSVLFAIGAVHVPWYRCRPPALPHACPCTHRRPCSRASGCSGSISARHRGITCARVCREKTMVRASAMWGLACSQERENPITTREAVAMAPSKSLDAPRSHSMASTRSRYLLASRVRVCHRHHGPGRREEMLASEEQVQGLRGRPRSPCRAPAVLASADAPLTVMLTDARAPAVDAIVPARLCGPQMLAPPQSLQCSWAAV